MKLNSIFCLIILFFLNFSTNFNAQSLVNANLTNEQIEKRIDEYNNKDPKKTWELINFYIQKSKREKNKEAILPSFL